MSFMDQIRHEKSQMNRIRFVVNYLVVPLYLAAGAIVVIVGYVLMTIDEQKNEPVFIALLIMFGVITVALLISVPFIRRIEIATEIRKHNYDISGVILPDSKLPVAVNEHLHLIFAEQGLTANGHLYAWSDFIIWISTSNKYKLIRVALDFVFADERKVILDDGESITGFSLVLTRELLCAIEAFGIPIKNRSDLDYILHNQKPAYTQIYLLGHIKGASLF